MNIGIASALAVLLSLLPTAALAQTSDEPATAAAETRRVQHPQSGTDLPIPAGWYLREEHKADGYAVFVSKEEIVTGGRFLTGFSLNWFAEVRARKGVTPSGYAAAFIDQIIQTRPGARREQAEIAPGVVVHEARYNHDSDGPPTMLLYFAIGDDRNDTLRLAWYEAPESTWDADWASGEAVVLEFLRSAARAASN